MALAPVGVLQLIGSQLEEQVEQRCWQNDVIGRDTRRLGVQPFVSAEKRALLAHRLAAVDVRAVGAGQFLIGAVFLAVAVALADGSSVRGWSATSVVTVVTLAVVGTALP